MDEDDIIDMDLIDVLVQEFVQPANSEDPLASSSLVIVLDENLTSVDGEELVEEAIWCSRFEELPPRDSIPLPSILEIPKL